MAGGTVRFPSLLPPPRLVRRVYYLRNRYFRGLLTLYLSVITFLILQLCIERLPRQYGHERTLWATSSLSATPRFEFPREHNLRILSRHNVRALQKWSAFHHVACCIAFSCRLSEDRTYRPSIRIMGHPSRSSFTPFFLPPST